MLSYAVGVVPAGRIQLGVPLYAYDWPRDAAAADGWGTATSLTYAGAEALRTSVGATRVWDTASSTPRFSYPKDGVEHRVWYEDQQSTTAKMKLVGTYKILGLVFWAVGSEDTRIWPALRDYATQRSTSLTSSAPPSVTYGSAVTVSGTLTRTTGTPISGATVRVQRKDAGTTAWVNVATTTTSSTGAASFRVSPTVNAQWRLTFPATWSYQSTVSPARTVKVRWRVTAAFADATVSKGTTATLRGTVGPVRSGTVAVVQRLVGTTWTTVGTRTVAADGSYSFAVRWNTAGKYTYRVRVESTTLNLAGATPSRVLTVS